MQITQVELKWLIMPTYYNMNAFRSAAMLLFPFSPKLLDRTIVY